MVALVTEFIIGSQGFGPRPNGQDSRNKKQSHRFSATKRSLTVILYSSAVDSSSKMIRTLWLRLEDGAAHDLSIKTMGAACTHTTEVFPLTAFRCCVCLLSRLIRISAAMFSAAGHVPGGYRRQHCDD